VIDRALRLAVRNYWSVFFAVAALTVPLQIAYATIWHDVIAVADLHDDIAAFPPLRQVHGVGREQLGDARLAYWVIWAIELAALPVLVRVTRRILDADAGGRLPSAADGWRGAFTGSGRGLVRALARPGPLIVGAALAALVLYLVRSIGGLLVEPLADERAFAGVGLVDGVARAAAAPFFLVVAAIAAGRGTERSGAPAPLGEATE
jgi:hypothetical protein